MWLSSGNQFNGAKDVLQFRLLQNVKGRAAQCSDDNIFRKNAINDIENNYEKNNKVKTNQKKNAKQAFFDYDMQEEDSDDNDDDSDIADNYDRKYARKYIDNDNEENKEKKRSFKRKISSVYSPMIKLKGGVKQENSVDGVSKSKKRFRKSSDAFY
jgi:hypothetical protein